ncbi:serine hydrolase domain-containing protein [Bernardetia sp.]|uniref:serine hydrolase domain-containing protein n=1 Tax=Bernardetia sp. TaxID=1937974 RepID=UPI0025C1F23F|nr:serine hydrolase domain-containing protein [Bernardetia sp.]
MRNLIFISAFIFHFIMFSAYAQSDWQAEVDSIIQKNTENQQLGVTVGITKNNKLVYHNYTGLANLEYNVPFNDSTIIGLASVTKQFTAACIAVLEKQKLLSVEEDIRKYIPELKVYEKPIRIKHLLNHTSGIRNHNVLLSLQGFDYEHRGYTNEMIQNLMFRQRDVNGIAGKKMLYSNTNYVFLALIVERVSGKTIADFAKDQLFEPLGMKNTFYRKDLEEVVSNKACGYYFDGKEYKHPKSLTLCVGAGGVKTTISDISEWSKIFLDNAHPFAYIAKFLTTKDALNDGSEITQARGVFVWEYAGKTVIEHGGRDIGMRSHFICIPKEKMSIMVYANSEHINAQGIAFNILDEINNNAETVTETNEQSIYQHSKSELEKFVGSYQEKNSDLLMNFFIENDTLKVKTNMGNTAVPLISSSENTLHRLNAKNVVYAFYNTSKNNQNSDIDLGVDFGGARFYFEKVELFPAEKFNTKEYVGKFYSDELDITYHIFQEKGNLVLSFPNNENILLSSRRKDEFGTGRRMRLSFKRNKNGKIHAFKVAAEGTVKDILFERIE